MNKAVFDEAYFEKGVKNKLSDYFDKQKIGCIEVADRIEKLVPSLQKGRSNILEVGCAYGQSVAALRYRGYAAYGCDISEYSVKEGRARVNVPIFEADLEAPGLVELVRNQTGYADFDLVFSCITLEHMHPEFVDRISKGLYALTKPGGVNYHAIDLFKGNDITHYCIMPREWWIERFAAAGFVALPVSPEGVRLNWFLFKKEAVK
jgi:SAM-dependent methyltransferase